MLHKGARFKFKILCFSIAKDRQMPNENKANESKKNR